MLSRLQLDEKEYVARTVMQINTKLHGAYVFSSGKNMGAFKAVGFPEDVGRFYRLDEYERVFLDGTRTLSHQHPRLVGRRSSLRPAGLFRGA